MEQSVLGSVLTSILLNFMVVMWVEACMLHSPKRIKTNTGVVLVVSWKIKKPASGELAGSDLIKGNNIRQNQLGASND